MGRNESCPLHNNQLEVLNSQKHEIAPDTYIVKYFDGLITIEMPKYGVIEIRLVSQVNQTQVTGVIAEGASDEDDNEADCPTSFKGKDWKQ